MSERTRKRGKKEKRVARLTNEILRLEGLKGRYEEKIPKVDAKLERFKAELEEAEKS